MGVEDFEEKEKEILQRIEAEGKNALKTGLVKGVPEEGFQAGYLVFIKYNEKCNEKIGLFSRKVSDSLGLKTINYGFGNAHQTIADCNLKIISAEEVFYPDSKKLEKIVGSVEIAVNIFKSKSVTPPYTIFRKYINSPDSVILTPAANLGNYQLIELVSDETTRQGLELRKAWGRHITTNRFKEDIPADELGEFKKLITSSHFLNAFNEEYPICADSLNIGYFTLNKKGFELTTVESIDMQ